MAKGYIGVDDKPRLIRTGYLGVDGQKRRIRKIYVGVDGHPKLVWSCPHKGGTTSTAASPANCTDYGTRNVYCGDCGDYMSNQTDDSAPPLGHNSEDSSTTSATCTASGSIVFRCSRCGAVQSTTSIPALGHNWGNWENTTSATCTSDGYHQKTCSRCDKTVGETIPALGHNWGAWQITTEATCGSAGHRQKTCSRCESTEDESIPATGEHNWGNWKVTTEATCVGDGRKERICSECESKDIESIPATGVHTPKYGWVDIETIATCTTPGTKTDECVVCYAKLTKTYTDPDNHDWGDWETLTGATCSSTGLRCRSCGRCGDMETETIPALGHNWITSSDGTKQTCSRCGLSQML